MPSSADRAAPWRRGAVLLLALAASAWSWSLTSFHGPGLDNDSAEYLAAARALLDGEGWRGVDGRPFHLWPPLYPALVAATSALGPSLESSVRVLNALAVLLDVVAAAWIAHRTTGSSTASLASAAGTAWFASSAAPMAWSEPLFTTFVLLAVHAWLRWRAEPTRGRWIAVVAWAAAAFAQRYVGAFLIAAFAADVLTSSELGPLRARLRSAVVLAGACALPVALWWLRNRLVTGALDGRRGPPSDDWTYDVARASTHLFSIPSDAQGVRGRFATWLPLALAALGAWRIARTSSDVRGARVVLVLPLLFAAGLVALRQLVQFDPIDERLVSPVLPFVALAASAGLAWLLSTRAALACVAAIALWGGFAFAPRARSELESRWSRASERGLGVYDSPSWRESPAIVWARASEFDGEVFSNEPFALSLLAGIRATALPGRPGAYERLFADWESRPARRRVIWFHLNDRARIPWGDHSASLAPAKTASPGGADVWDFPER